MEFGEWLVQQLRARGRSRRWLAQSAGFTDATVAGWVRAGARPSWENCEKIAQVLEIPVAEVRELAGYKLDEDYVHIPGWADLPETAQKDILGYVDEVRRMTPRESDRDSHGGDPENGEAGGLRAG